MSTVFANPPYAIDVQYNKDRGEVIIAVQHFVTNPKEHYIQKIEIEQNGKVVAEKKFNFQTSHRRQTIVPIKIDAKQGNKITVRAFCNQSGSLSKNVNL